MQFDVKVETRETVGKGVARTLRRQGKIPGILYGQGECLALTVDPAEIDRKSTRLNSSHIQKSRMPSSA